MFKVLFTTVVCLLLSTGVSNAVSLPDNVENYFLGYEAGLSKDMKKFKMVITDVRNYSKEEIMKLKKKGITVIGYVSVGESAQLQKGDGLGPGGYASWYFDLDNDGCPDQNKEFKSYYTNAANSLWVNQVINKEMKRAADKGVDGFFLDTIDTIEKYPQTKEAMINLIKNVRQKYPDKILIQNWGFSIVETTAPYINAFMWESWYPDSNDQWVINWQNKLKELKAKYGIDVLTLGYYKVYSNLERYYEASKSLGFLPFIISDSNMNEVVDFFSKKTIPPMPHKQIKIKTKPEPLKQYFEAYRLASVKFITKLKAILQFIQ